MTDLQLLTITFQKLGKPAVDTNILNRDGNPMDVWKRYQGIDWKRTATVIEQLQRCDEFNTAVAHLMSNTNGSCDPIRLLDTVIRHNYMFYYQHRTNPRKVAEWFANDIIIVLQTHIGAFDFGFALHDKMLSPDVLQEQIKKKYNSSPPKKMTLQDKCENAIDNWSNCEDISWNSPFYLIELKLCPLFLEALIAAYRYDHENKTGSQNIDRYICIILRHNQGYKRLVVNSMDHFERESKMVAEISRSIFYDSKSWDGCQGLIAELHHRLRLTTSESANYKILPAPKQFPEAPIQKLEAELITPDEQIIKDANAIIKQKNEEINIHNMSIKRIHFMYKCINYMLIALPMVFCPLIGTSAMITGIAIYSIPMLIKPWKYFFKAKPLLEEIKY